ncbi:predicted protein [Lichtheimia corymbifera JMRC:FSU:9682]|uniref:Uncharacterized protein n=1 Tax=Lichtheimia corymbifera JMRC:FSU:9682 TaxID=1263082 RepID=A0A068RY82_9FUNG|nr:predicted protein [Lichtheimia corymbifera JMRC:FSU:9682]
MPAFWSRQSLEHRDETPMESLYKACLAGLDTVLHEMVVDITSDKSYHGTSLLGSIQHSVSSLVRNTSTIASTAHELFEQVERLLLSDLWMLTTAHVPFARVLVAVLRSLELDNDYSTMHLSWDQAHAKIATALENIPSSLANTPSIRALLRHYNNDDENEKPPAYTDLETHHQQPLEEKPPQYDELDRIMATVFRLSTGYSNQRVEMLHPLPQKRSLTDLLAKSLHRPSYSRQRFQLSSDKERDLFMNGLLHKVDRLEGRRLSNQDADPPRDELEDLLHHICRAKRTRLDNQRAAFTTTTALLRS